MVSAANLHLYTEDPAGEENIIAGIAGGPWMGTAGVGEANGHGDVPSTPPAKPGSGVGDGGETPGIEPPSTPFSPTTPGGTSARGDEFYEHLTEVEHGRLRMMRASVVKEVSSGRLNLSTPALKRFITDACLCRYLRARKWDVAKSMKMLKKSLEWRAHFKPEDLTWDDVKHEGETGKQFCAGKDRKGRTVGICNRL